MILSTLLEREVGKIHINTQKVISAGAPNLRGLRMDVEIIESAGNVILQNYPICILLQFYRMIHSERIT